VDQAARRDEDTDEGRDAPPPAISGGTFPTSSSCSSAGYGAGKSDHTFASGPMAAALANAPAPVAIVSPTFPLARHTIVATMVALLSGKQTLYGPHQFWFRYNKSTHEFKIRFRGRNALVIVYSGEDPLSLRGPNLAAAYIDEPFIQEQAVFDQMIARVRHPDARFKEIGMTGTPEGISDWGYDLAVGEMKDKYDVAMVRASTRGNYVLDDNYVARLEGSLTGKAAEGYIEGAFVSLSTGLVYYAFGGLNSGSVQHIDMPRGAELGCGMDFNVNPFAFNVFWRAGSHMHFIAEYELPNADTQYACSVLRDEWTMRGDPEKRRPEVNQDNQLRTVYPDASGSSRHTSSPGGKSDFHYIKEAGFEIRAPSANPRIRDREESVNGKFKPKFGETTLTIDPKCKKLIKYSSTYSHELKPKQKSMAHLLDAMGYPVYQLFPVSKETLSVHTLTGV
jgi:hypothetical protein